VVQDKMGTLQLQQEMHVEHQRQRQNQLLFRQQHQQHQEQLLEQLLSAQH
jgi:hypothetical protein